MRTRTLIRSLERNLLRSTSASKNAPISHHPSQLFYSTSALSSSSSSSSSVSNSNSTAPETLPKPSNKLLQIIKDSIKSTGPIPVSRYMQFCLSHPTEGYYSKGDVFGKRGDFITSPEISQIFGELLAIWLLTRYMAAGNPPKVRLIELGPGRGTLMDDVLRTLSSFPAIAGSIKSVYLVENSLKMQDIQLQTLEARTTKKGIKLEWSDKIDDIPESDEFTMILAHEFFDAIPINVFEKRENGYREILIDISRGRGQGCDDLHLSISKEPTTLSTVLPATSPRFAKLPIGSRIEVAQESWRILRRCGELISFGEGGGAGVVVDYGGERAYGQSFRAFRNHKIVDVFDEPGSSDLTANVDFAYLKESLEGVATPLGPIAQGYFLQNLGLQPRLKKLLDSAPNDERRNDLQKGAQRLADMLGMGSQYQVMGIVKKGEESSGIYPFS